MEVRACAGEARSPFSPTETIEDFSTNPCRGSVRSGPPVVPGASAMQRQVAPSFSVPIEERASHFHLLRPSHLHFAHPRRAPPRLDHATMASDTSSTSSKPPMTSAELVAFVKKELDTDEERQAKVVAASAGEVPRESQTGSTLDLSHKNINALPPEVIVLIKDKVER